MRWLLVLLCLLGLCGALGLLVGARDAFEQEADLRGLWLVLLALLLSVIAARLANPEEGAD